MKFGQQNRGVFRTNNSNALAKPPTNVNNQDQAISNEKRSDQQQKQIAKQHVNQVEKIKPPKLGQHPQTKSILQKIKSTVKRTKEKLGQIKRENDSLNRRKESSVYAKAYTFIPKPTFHTEETKPRKKSTRFNQLMGFNAGFGQKSSSDTSGDAALAANAYESTRFNIPFERDDSAEMPIGFDAEVKDQDRMNQLRRRKAMKIARAVIDEEGVWGSGTGGFAGLPVSGTGNSSQAGGAQPIGTDGENTAYTYTKKGKRQPRI